MVDLDQMISIIFMVGVTTVVVLFLCVVWPVILSLSPKQPRVDYRKINETELDLGLPLSNYQAHGVDRVAMIEERIARPIITENQRVIDHVEEVLHPEEALRKQVANAYAISPQVMGNELYACPHCGSTRVKPLKHQFVCLLCYYVFSREPALEPAALIQPMDEPYPVEIIQHAQRCGICTCNIHPSLPGRGYCVVHRTT